MADRTISRRRKTRSATATTIPATPKSATVAQLGSEYSERTTDRILAWLGSLESIFPDDPDQDAYARSIVYRIARSANNEDDRPKLKLTADEAAEVLRFMAQATPADPAIWWEDPMDAPSRVCGFQAVLFSIIESIDPARTAQEAA